MDAFWSITVYDENRLPVRERAEGVFGKQRNRQAGEGRLVRDPVRRRPEVGGQLPGDQAGLELLVAALSPAHRNPRRHLEGAGTRAAEVNCLPLSGRDEKLAAGERFVLDPFLSTIQGGKQHEEDLILRRSRWTGSCDHRISGCPAETQVRGGCSQIDPNSGRSRDQAPRPTQRSRRHAKQGDRREGERLHRRVTRGRSIHERYASDVAVRGRSTG